MKRIVLIAATVVLAVSVAAQGNSGGKGKDKQKDKGNSSQTDNSGNSKDKEDKAKHDEHDRKIWDGIGDKNSNCMKPSKNQPAKVRSSFQRDYPYAVNVRWTKCRGDWTASFGNGLFRSTAVYHANGQRRDTRTPITRDDIPRRILDEIFKRRPNDRLEDAIKIEVPNVIKEIFRIKNMLQGKTEYQYYNSDGIQVSYNY